MEQRSARQQFVVVASVTATAALGFSAIVPALPELAEELGVGAAAVGFLQSSVAIPGVMLTPFVGLLSDRFGRRRVLLWALVAFGLTGVAGAFAPSFGVLLALRLAMGIPYAGLLALTPVVLTDLFDGPHRARAIGFNTAALTIASTLGPVVGGVLADGGAQRAFLIYAIAFPALLVARRLELADGGPMPSVAPRVVLEEIRRSGRLRDLVGSMPYTVVFMAVFVGFSFVVVPLFLEDTLQVSVVGRGPVVGAANLGSAGASLLFTRLAGRIRSRHLLQLGQLAAGVGLVVLFVSNGLVGVVIGVLLLGLAVGTTYNTVQVFVATASPPQRRGVVVGSWSSASRLGQVLGGSLGGVLVVAVGGRGAFAVGLVAIAALAVLWLPVRSLVTRQPTAG